MNGPVILERKVLKSSLTPPPPGTWGEKYRTGAWTPIHEEVHAKSLTVLEGSIPRDICGRYIRNTENPVHDSRDGNVNYHPFDGDGLLHSIHFKDGEVEYMNKFIRTKAFIEEQKMGRALWVGLLEYRLSKIRSERPGWGQAVGKIYKLKDTASTDVVVHAGKIIPSWYQCGEAYCLDLETLETEGVHHWTPEAGMSAHAKVDESTGELLFFNYGLERAAGKGPPTAFMHYGVVDANNNLTNYIRLPFVDAFAPEPGSHISFPHDMAFSKNFAILNHFSGSAHFAIVPRRAHSLDEVKFFKGSKTYVLHWLNAYEEGDEIVLDGYRMRKPEVFTKLDNMDLCQCVPQLWRWRFNLKTGETVESCLDERVFEFGVINQKWTGRKNHFAYSVHPHKGEFMFTGLTKNNLDDSTRSISYEFGPERYGSEVGFAPRIGGKDEDDGYLVTFVTDVRRDRSECVVFDAKHLEQGPVTTILLPHRISSGTHACWIDDSSPLAKIPVTSKVVRSYL